MMNDEGCAEQFPPPWQFERLLLITVVVDVDPP